MIWAKSDAGRVEMQRRALVTDRQLRSLLLLVDGSTSQEMLLGHISGLTPEHFQTLHRLGLIEAADTRRPAGSRAPAAPEAPAAEPAPAVATSASTLDYGSFTGRLTQLISTHLGLRGFTLTLAVEKASTIEELLEVGRRVVEQIRARRGDSTADAAQRALFE